MLIDGAFGSDWIMGVILDWFSIVLGVADRFFKKGRQSLGVVGTNQ